MTTAISTPPQAAAPVPNAPIAATLATFANELTYDRIPVAVRERAKHLMLDSIGIAMASTKYDFAHRTLSAMSGMGGGNSVVIGMSSRLAMRDAALVNGVLIHGLDYDDTHIQAATHVTCSMLPAALAVASERGLSGRDLLAAFVAGIEVAGRIGSVTQQGEWHKIGWHPTGVVGTFACAMVAGKLFGLSDEQLAMAQGIALSMASGSMEFLNDGAWTKRMHPGWAAVSGINAAALAKQGFQGPRRPYEGRFGFYNIHLGPLAEGLDLSRAVAELHQRWEVGRVAVKPFPACHFNHATADATLALVREHGLKAEQVAQVTVLMPKESLPVVCEPIEAKRAPQNAYEAQFSIPYTVAASCVRGKFGLAELENDALNDPKIRALAQKVGYQIDPDATFPDYFSGEVIVKTIDGRELRYREAKNRGAGDRPLSSQDIVAKFRDNAHLVASPERAERVHDAVLGLDKFDDTRQWADLLAG